MIFDIIPYLPEEIVNIIFSKLNPLQLIFINKEYYYKLNHLVDTIITKGRYDSFLRDIIRHDYNFVFKNILHRKFNNWILFKNYKYKNTTYPDFVHFLLFYSKNNNSHRCNDLINLQLQLSGLKKDWCKNNRIKYSQWIN